MITRSSRESFARTSGGKANTTSAPSFKSSNHCLPQYNRQFSRNKHGFSSSRLIGRSSSEHGPLGSFTQRSDQLEGHDRLAGGLSHSNSQTGQSASPSLQPTSSVFVSSPQLEILKKLRDESQQRLILQAELLQAEHKSLESELKIEALVTELETSKREREAIEERSERLSAALSMMETKTTKLAAECAGLRDSLQRAEASRDQAGTVMERELNQLKEEASSLKAQLLEARNEREASSEYLTMIKGLQDSLVMEIEKRVELEKEKEKEKERESSSDLVMGDVLSQLREASLDRGIIEGNFRHAVKQSIELMHERDQALAAASDALRANEKVEEKARQLEAELLTATKFYSETAEKLNESIKREENLQSALDELKRKDRANQRYFLQRAEARSLNERSKPINDGRSPAFSNTNRFYVPDSDLLSFMRCIAIRSESFLSVEGFLGMVVQPDPQGRKGVYLVATNWNEMKCFERWSRTGESRKLEPFPSGVLQFMPAKGEGLPEDSVGLKDL